MKAKEIVQALRQSVQEGSIAVDATSKQLVDDLTRMQTQARERKCSAAAIIRMAKEYNQKWNSVVESLKDDLAFVAEGKPFLHSDVFACVFTASISKGASEVERNELTRLILRPQAFTNEELRQFEREWSSQKELASFLSL